MQTINNYHDLPLICAYCAGGPPLTKEHVIPRKFRQESAAEHEWIDVRACTKCNNDKSRLDEQVRNLLILHQDSDGHDGAIQARNGPVLKSIHRLIANGRMNPTLQMLKSMESVLVVGPDGTLLPKMAGVAPSDQFTPWLTLVAKGLTMALTGKPLVDANFEVLVLTRANFYQLLPQLSDFSPPVCLGDHTKFSFRPLEGQPGYGVWLFQFFDGLAFIVFAVPSYFDDGLDEVG